MKNNLSKKKSYDHTKFLFLITFSLSITNRTRFLAPRDFFEKLTKAATVICPSFQNSQVSLVLIGLKQISQLNRKYRHKTGPTDTISFAFNDSQPFPGAQPLGEIFLCPMFIKKQALKKENSFQQEMAAVFVHSLLHLFGYDHRTGREEAQMNQIATKILFDLPPSCTS